LNTNDSRFRFASHQQELLDHALSGYFGWAGMRLIDASSGAARVGFRPRAEMLTPWNTLNGGVINGLLELPSFVALLTLLEAGELPVTNDVFLQHLRPLPGDADYVLDGSVIRRGKSMAWTEVAVRAGGEVVSIARITKTIRRDPIVTDPAQRTISRNSLAK
jgi:uncharacterized protein (TIGR00369 family)